ncbi:MAG: efflux RND transporter permease subunit, partial [Aestuariivirgaceae bacterium]
RNITVADVEQALRRSNVELPAGEVESLNREFTVKLAGRINDAPAFRELVVAQVAGYPVKLGDIAQVARGVEDDRTNVRANGVEAVGLGVLRQSQANTVAISKAVRAEIETLKPMLPDGMKIEVGSDDAIFIDASIHQVMKGLLEALGLVVLVILLFLRSFRATLVPAVTIPISLIGCFVLMHAMGYSVNVLTLLALILAIGLVVDDAIVVLENIQRRIDEGESPLKASCLGTRQVTFAVVATSATLIAVFVPISFLEGQIGKLFVEFGFVMAGAVAISTLVALTLCPALASRLLKPKKGPVHHHAAGDRGMLRLYRVVLERALNVPIVVIMLALGFAAMSVGLFLGLPRELTPVEDRGTLFVQVTAPQGSTLAYTDGETREIERRLAPLKERGVASTVYAVAGQNAQAYRAFVVLRLEPWEARDEGLTQIMREVIPKVTGIPGVRAYPTVPAALGLRGSRTPLSAVISGPDFDSVKAWARQMLEAAEKDPRLKNAELDFEETQPQLSVVVDRKRADDLGISMETIASTLQTLFASREVTNFIDRGREYKVVVEARAGDRMTPDDVANIFVRAGDGKTLVPLSALISMKEEAAAPALRRYNRLPSITLTASLGEGYALGQAIDDFERLARDTLPAEAKLGWSGQSQQFREASGGIIVTFVLALLIVFLVLAAQFESFVHPLVIMLSVPLALAGAVYALFFTGLSLNLYSQIGIVLLIGLMAKNGILIVEFANQLRNEGRSIREAVVEASVLRLRPILMTVIATVLGAVPLVLASGAGAESRIAIGTVIVGGLSVATVLTLFFTPVLYLLLAGLTSPGNETEKALEAELAGDVATRHPPGELPPPDLREAAE